MTPPQPTLPFHPIARLTGHTGPINALTYSAGSGQYILTGSSDRNIHLYNPSKAVSSTSTTTSLPASSAKPKDSPALIQRYTGVHGHSVLAISVSSDNARFVSGGGDRAVFLWDVATALTLRRFGANGPGGHAGKVEAVAFAGEGDAVVCSGGFDATVRLWDCKAQGGRPIMVLSEAGDSVVAISVGGAEVWAGSVDGRVRGYDVRMGRCWVDVIGEPVTSLTPTTDGQTHLLSTPTSSLLLLDNTTGKLLQKYSHPSFQNTTYRLRSTLSAPDNKLVVSGSEDGWVCAWDVLTGQFVGRVRHVKEGAQGSASRNVVSCVAWRRGRREWASAGGDGTVVVWGESQGKEED